MKISFIIISFLFQLISFSQEAKIIEIENKIDLIDNQLNLIEKQILIDNQNENLLKLFRDNEKLLKIIEFRKTNYGEIQTVIYLNNLKPIKIVEIQSVNYWLTDSEKEIKSYDIGLREEFRITAYIFDWIKNEKKIFFEGERLNKKISFNSKKYQKILRNANQIKW